MGGGGGPTLKASLSREQGYLVGTTATTATQSVAFFGFGSPANDTIDTFDGNNELTRLSREYQGNVRTIILSSNGKTAATSITCGTDSYALFGGGFYNDGTTKDNNDVDIFKCNDDGVFYYDLQQLAGLGRANLAATSVTCGNDSYALFGGGFSRSGNYSNDVDIFKCNDTGVFYHKTIQFNGPERSNLAATTIRVDGKEYALFAGGVELPTNYSTIDIYDCETEQFLPL
jgi:hypothetical protein